MKRLPLLLSLIFATTLAVTQVEARSSFKKQLLTAYPQAANTDLAKCTVCHTMPGYATRNTFGTDFANNGMDFKAIEQMDSDDDGFSNLEEINAGTLPGDAESKPQ